MELDHREWVSRLLKDSTQLRKVDKKWQNTHNCGTDRSHLPKDAADNHGLGGYAFDRVTDFGSVK